MNGNNEKSNKAKIYDIANDDLMFISCFFSKIRATSLGLYSYLDNIAEPNEHTNNALYALDVIEDLTALASNSLNETVRKLCEISGEMEASK